MDRPSFLFFVRAVLPERARRRPVWAAPEGGGQILIKTSCSARLHCAEWSCVVLSDSPRRHNGAGRDWPDSAVKLVDDLAGESPASASFPVGTVVIPGDGAGDQPVESPEVNVLDGWIQSGQLRQEGKQSNRS